MQLNLSKHPESVLFQAVFDKKIVFGLVFIKVCPILVVYFREKKSPAQFVFGFGVYEPTARLGRKWGKSKDTFPLVGN